MAGWSEFLDDPVTGPESLVARVEWDTIGVRGRLSRCRIRSRTTRTRQRRLRVTWWGSWVERACDVSTVRFHASDTYYSEPELRCFHRH